MLMFCMKCGKKIDDGSKFCQFCGSAIKDNVSQSVPQQQPQIPVGKKVNPILVGGIGLGCLAVVLCGVHFLISDKQDSSAEVVTTEPASVEDSTDKSVTELASVKDSTDKSASTPADDTEVEETDTSNDIYFLTESDVTSQLEGFFNFCWSNSAFNNNRDLGQDTIDLADVEHCFMSLYAITVEKSMDVGLVAIYETNPNLIVTDDFAETCLAGGGTDLNNLINDCCKNKSRIKFVGSNISNSWHFYEGTDESVYVAVSIDNNPYTIEMVQCTGDPYKWLINNVDMHLRHDLLDVKLKNEDGAQDEGGIVEQADWIATYNDYFSLAPYITNARYVSIYDLNSDGIPEVYLGYPYHDDDTGILPALFYINADGAVDYIQYAQAFYPDMIYCYHNLSIDTGCTSVYQYDNNTGSYIKIFEGEEDENVRALLNTEDLVSFMDKDYGYSDDKSFWNLANDQSLFVSVIEELLISWQKDNS